MENAIFSSDREVRKWLAVARSQTSADVLETKLNLIFPDFVASEFRNEYKTSKPVRETAINTNTISTAKMRIKKNDSQ